MNRHSADCVRLLFEIWRFFNFLKLKNKSPVSSCVRSRLQMDIQPVPSSSMTCLIAREHRGDNLLSESSHVPCETEIKPLEQCFSHRSRAKVSPWALHATPKELRKISQTERYTTSSQPLGPFRQCVQRVPCVCVLLYIFQFQFNLISVSFSGQNQIRLWTRHSFVWRRSVCIRRCVVSRVLFGMHRISEGEMCDGGNKIKCIDTNNNNIEREREGEEKEWMLGGGGEASLMFSSYRRPNDDIRKC